MKIDTHYLKVEKTARYSSFGQLSSKTKYFWVVLHGSKMLCEQMLYKFESFDPQTHFVIAPEGLSRLYEKGFGGDVVATWMTKRDRLKEIDDFSNYLSQLLNAYQPQLPSGCKKILFGFSQGGTTAFRWIHKNKTEFDHILAYSCWIPEDIDLKLSKTDLNTTNMVYTYGEEDQFLTQDRIGVLKKIIVSNNLKINLEAYVGQHRVDKKQLSALFLKYISY